MNRSTLAELAAVLLVSTHTGFAQSSAGELVGTVRDPSGAVVVNAAVEAREVETGAIRRTATNGRGDYRILELPVGHYEAAVEAPGFKRSVRPGLDVQVEQSLRVDFAMEIGAASETVSITTQAPAIDTEKGTIESRVLSDQMLELPLNGRNPIELMNLNAGVDYGRSTNYEAVSGNRDDGSVLNVEGAMSIDVLGRALLPILPLDAVSEFVIKTSIPTADSGLGNSAVSMAVKSGTNLFHGSLYEFWRGTVGNARDFFNPTDVLPPLVRNQFGGSLSGPFLKNRTFFFVNYELTRQASSTNARATVPTLAYRNGLLGGSFKDPLNGQLFAGGQVPASRFDPLSLQMLQDMPLPNQPGTVNNFYTQIPSWGNSSTPILKLDQQLSANQRLMLMARGSFSRGYTPGALPTVGGLFTWGNADAFTARHDWVITPRLLNQASWGFFKNASISYPQLRGVDILSQLGLTAFMPLSSAAENGFPDVRITGFPNMTDVGSVPGISNQRYFSVTDDLSWVRGNHSLKFGGSVYWLYLRRLAVTLNRGQLLYQGTLSGSPMADYLLGLPSQASADVGGDIANETRRYYAGYIMDDWRITSRLTLNVGLRYELYTIPTEDSNRFGSYDIVTRDLVVSSNSNTLPSGLLPQFLGGNSPIPVITTHQAGMPLGFSNTNTTDFGPRFGFAYRLPGARTTVIRGGYGWFYNPIRMDARLIAANNNAPFMALEYYQNVVGKSPVLLNAVQSAANMGVGSTAGATLQINGIARNFPDSLDPQWNFTIERDLGAQFTSRISYVGNRGIHLPVNLNYAQDFVDTNPVTGKPQLDRIERRVNPVEIEEAASRSFYHALQTELRRQFRNGISVQLNWTWQKLLSDAETDQSIPQNSFCLRCDYADAAYTRRHMVKFNFIYDLPLGPGKQFLKHGILSRTIGGWRLTGIGQWETGLRFTPTYSKTGATDDLRAGRPDLIGDPNSGPHLVTDWFNLNAFLIPPPLPGGVAGLVFGNSARNLVVGPSLSAVNLSLQKIFKLTERFTLSLRLETFNAFNQTNLGSPALDLAQITAGVISSTAAASRQNQIAGRIDF
jgi:hypothetical protein